MSATEAALAKRTEDTDPRPTSVIRQRKATMVNSSTLHSRSERRSARELIDIDPSPSEGE
jgi:hypothetical protein